VAEQEVALSIPRGSRAPLKSAEESLPMTEISPTKQVMGHQPVSDFAQKASDELIEGAVDEYSSKLSPRI
jgi:hypothetical protein